MVVQAAGAVASGAVAALGVEGRDVSEAAV